MKVNVEKMCGCLKKSGLTFPKEFSSKEEAELEALRLANYMNDKFCKKHRFVVNENEDEFLIKVELASQSS